MIAAVVIVSSQPSPGAKIVGMVIDFASLRVVIKGAGDLATGIALRLHRSGFAVVMTEIAQPLAVRRTVALASAVFEGVYRVEDVTAVRCELQDVEAALARRQLPVLVDPEAHCIGALAPAVVVDAIMAKRNTGTRISDASLVIGVGPGFTAGVDCHAVVETNRGHNLGRVFWQGRAEPDTGAPGEVSGMGQRATRVLRAPADGRVINQRAIGDFVAAGAIIATLVATSGDEHFELVAPFDGVLRGLIHPSVFVRAGTKIGDLDPRADRSYCFTVSDKALAIGGGVLEAALCGLQNDK